MSRRDSGGGGRYIADGHGTTVVGTFASNITRVERSQTQFQSENILSDIATRSPDDSTSFSNDESDIITFNVSNLIASSNLTLPLTSQNDSIVTYLAANEIDRVLPNKNSEYLDNHSFHTKADGLSVANYSSHYDDVDLNHRMAMLDDSVASTTPFELSNALEYIEGAMMGEEYMNEQQQQMFLNESGNELDTAFQALHNVHSQNNMSDDAYHAASAGFELEKDTAWVISIMSVSVASLYALIFIVGLFGNSLVLATVLSIKRLRTTTYKLAANLAIADLLVLIFCLPANLLTEINKNW